MKKFQGVGGGPTQKRLVVEYLANGGQLTKLTAFIKFGIQNLAARITELREMGYIIKLKKKREPNGKLTSFYYMESKETHFNEFVGTFMVDKEAGKYVCPFV